MNFRKLVNNETGNSKTIGALFICIAATLWGLDGVVLTPRLFNLDVELVVFMLHALPFAFLNIFLFKEYRHLKTFTKMDVLGFFLVSLFGGAVGTLAMVKALFLVNFQNLTVVVLLQKLQPVFAIGLASLILKEKLTARFLFWAGLAVIGGYFLTFGPHLPHFVGGSNTLQSSLYALLAAFSFGSATVFGKKVLNKFSFSTATFYRYGFTTLLMLILVLSGGKLTHLQYITSTNWIIFGIITLTSGSGAILLYYFGLKRVTAMVSTICELCFPISAIIFDYFINGKMITPVQWFSAILMILAIINLTKEKKPKPKLIKLELSSLRS